MPFRSTLPQFRPTHARFFTSFCVVILFFAQAAAEASSPLKFQLRSRSPFVKEKLPEAHSKILANYQSIWKIDYRTVKWDPAKTAVVVFDKPSLHQSQMALTLDRVLEKLKEQGVLILNSKLQPAGYDVQEQLKQHGIENAIVMGSPLKPSSLTLPVKNMVVMRDLTNIAYEPSSDDKLSQAQIQEDAIKHIEKYVPTITSTDVLGESAFCPKEDKRPHVAIIVSDDHYGADVTLPIYADELREKYNCRVSILHGEGGSNIHGIAELKKADCLIVFVRRLALPKEQLDAIRAYVASGRPVIGLRTASHAFDTKGKIPEGCDNWVEFDAEVLGGNYHNHAGNALGSDIAIVPEMKDHPILKGVQPLKWHSTGSLYFTKPIKKDCTLLMTGTIPGGEPEPVLWFRKHGESTVIYCGLGHPDDFKTEQFRKLLANMVLWSLKQ